MAQPDETTGAPWMSKLASTAIVVAALYLAKGLLVPFTLAVLLSFLLAPLCDRLERLGRVAAVLSSRTSVGSSDGRQTRLLRQTRFGRCAGLSIDCGERTPSNGEKAGFPC